MRRLAKFVLILAIFGTVTALAGPDTAPTAPPPSAGPGSNGPTMSLGEMNVAAANIEARLEEDTQQVLRLQEVAKKAKDVIKLNCVNDRLVQLKAQRNVADETRTQLNTALAKNSDDRQSIYNQLVSTSEQVKELREQAKACVGEPELFKQESGVTVEHPDLPDDPTIINPGIEPVEPPGYASPYD